MTAAETLELLTLDNDRLEYSMNMATQRTPDLQNHLRAVLRRAPDVTR
ncbi:MAG: hypothetical protein HKN12_04585 [Gemmatimonadetes bacterium]|nr:hypothetical protein [Gemmatimonadota bacterium]